MQYRSWRKNLVVGAGGLNDPVFLVLAAGKPGQIAVFNRQGSKNLAIFVHRQELGLQGVGIFFQIGIGVYADPMQSDATVKAWIL